jgi:hypothetical protein
MKDVPEAVLGNPDVFDPPSRPGIFEQVSDMRGGLDGGMGGIITDRVHHGHHRRTAARGHDSEMLGCREQPERKGAQAHGKQWTKDGELSSSSDARRPYATSEHEQGRRPDSKRRPEDKIESCWTA